METSCIGHPMFCRECSDKEHIVHRTNDLRLLFTDNKLYTTEAQMLHLLNETALFVKQQKEAARLLLESCSRLYEAYEKSLTEVETIRSQYESTRWCDDIYNVVEEYFRKRLPAKEASSVFK